MLLRFWRNPFYRFLGLAGLLYVGWFFFYDLWIHPNGWFDEWMVKRIVSDTESVLQFLGFETLYGQTDIRLVGISNSSGVWIGDECNGITLFALFTGFILAFPGPLLKKLWFMPLGILAIHILNVMRVAALAMFAKFAPEKLEFNHTYTFTILVYSLVFLLWYLWAYKIAGIEKNR
jgi:exosortase family protein XrtF